MSAPLSLGTLTLGLLLATGAFAGGNSAPTGDGKPASRETICDSYKGATYGICTAACRAIDVESPDATANHSAFEALRARWLDLTGQKRFPCECGKTRKFAEAQAALFTYAAKYAIESDVFAT